MRTRGSTPPKQSSRPACWRSCGGVTNRSVGAAGAWVGTEKLLLWLWPGYPRAAVVPVDPLTLLGSGPLAYAFIGLRIASAVLLVPIMEELFWRDYLWRTVIAPADFRLG